MLRTRKENTTTLPLGMMLSATVRLTTNFICFCWMLHKTATRLDEPLDLLHLDKSWAHKELLCFQPAFSKQTHVDWDVAAWGTEHSSQKCWAFSCSHICSYTWCNSFQKLLRPLNASKHVQITYFITGIGPEELNQPQTRRPTGILHCRCREANHL